MDMHGLAIVTRYSVKKAPVLTIHGHFNNNTKHLELNLYALLVPLFAHMTYL